VLNARHRHQKRGRHGLVRGSSREFPVPADLERLFPRNDHHLKPDLGALLGVGLSGGFAAAYPIGLGLAAGAMIFVVSHEVIPETHRNGHQTPATLGLMGGSALMMVLDATLG